MLKWIGIVGLGLLGIAVVVVAVLGFRFLAWRGDVERRLAQRSIVVQTSAGSIEYGEMGSGIPVLMLHGTPGGFDTFLNMAEATDSYGAGLRIISPSRPGYLRTPIESGATPEEQARLYAALLDKLGIEKVFVMGASGGGPSALQFAMRYPDRCAGLVLEAAVTHRIVVKQQWFPALLQDFLLSVFRNSAIRELQGSNPSDPTLTKIGGALFDSLIPSSPRAIGVANDLKQYARIENWDLGSIRCPTLIVTGSADADVPPEHAEFAHSKIVNSELVILKGADHSFFFKNYRELNELMHAFIARHQ
jgi:pimeloyl-ACP methyl ester carboxylesterase